MAVQRAQDNDASEFMIETDESGAIVRIDGPWPDRPEFDFELRGATCDFTEAANAPAELRARALAGGLQVCHYDPVHCRTCYCDSRGKIIRCVGQC